MIERAEVSSSRSTLEVYESRWRKGLDGWDKTDADYLTPDDSSCSREVACHKVGWKPRIRQERLGLGILMTGLAAAVFLKEQALIK